MRMRWTGVGVMMAGLLAVAVRTTQAQQTGSRDEDTAKMTEVAGDHLDQSVRCEGHGVTITGSDSRLSVLGPCTEVRVAGSRNWLTVGAAQRIVTTGDRNTVEYTERRTRVSDRGKANTVAEKYPQ